MILMDWKDVYFFRINNRFFLFVLILRFSEVIIMVIWLNLKVIMKEVIVVFDFYFDKIYGKS